MSQVYQTNIEFKRTLKIVIAVSLLYLILVSISISTLIIIAVICVSLLGLLKLKITEIKEKGPDNFSPKLKHLLFEKSIFDIYSDIIYFPTISKIIGAFIKPALAKPHPEQLKQSFEEIHPKAKQIISTKGLINLFPDQIRAIGYKEDEPLPPIKNNDWTWYNADRYKIHEQVHQDTLGKRIVQKVDNKFNWTTLSILTLLVGIGIKKMSPEKAKKMLVYNGCFAGIIIVILLGIIKISHRNKNKPKHSHLSIEAKIIQD